MARKVMITVAPTGGFAQKSDSPNLPVTPEEIADSVYKSWQAGASIAAIHARRDDGAITNDPEVYRKINKLVRDRCDIIINNSTGGGLGPEMYKIHPDGSWEMDFEKRLWGTQAGAEMCTLDCQTQTIDFGKDRVPGITHTTEPGLFNTSWQRSKKMMQIMHEKGIKPEFEVMDLSHITDDARMVLEMGLDNAPHYFDIVLGTNRRFQSALPYTYKILDLMIDFLPENSIFCTAAVGPAQLPANIQSILRGGHVRTGLEDNLYFSKGVKATNEMLVERIARIIRDLGHEVATPAEAREMLGLKK